MRTALCILYILFMATGSRCQADGIYVSDAGNFSSPPWKILRYDLDGADPVVYITDQLAWPQDFLFLDGVGEVLVSNLNTGKIARHDAVTGSYLGDFATGIGGPTRMGLGPDSLLYVLQWTGNGRVRRYGLDGGYLGEFTTVGVPQSIGIAWDAAGDLYVSSYTGGLVRRFDGAGNDLGVFIDADLVGPTNIWFDANGDLLVADFDGGAVKRFDPSGAYLGTFITGLSQVEGVAHYPDGSFLLGNGGTSSVKRYDATGAYVDDLIPGGLGGLLTPNAIVIRGATGIGMAEENAGATGLSIQPTAGRWFTIEPVRPGLVRSIEVRSMTGERVARIAARTFSATHLATGVYVVVVEWEDGARAARRIEVID